MSVELLTQHYMEFLSTKGCCTGSCESTPVKIPHCWKSHVAAFSVLCLLCLYARLFICALWSPAGKGLTSWLPFVVYNCEFVTFQLVSWAGCST